MESSSEEDLSAWEKVLIARDPERPQGLDYIEGLCSEFISLHGDRILGDDSSLITGFLT